MVRKHKNDQYRQKITNEIEVYDEIISKAGKIVDLIPRIQEMKDEAELNLRIYDEIPEELIDEMSPYLEVSFISRFSQISKINDLIPVFSQDIVSLTSASAAGTATITSTLTKSYPQQQTRPIWAQNVINYSVEIADIKVKSQLIPIFLDNLRPGLSAEYRDSERIFLRAKAGTISSMHAANSMRNLIQQIWGAIVDKSRFESQGCLTKNHYQLNKSVDRIEISKMFSKNTSQKATEDLFSQLFLLYGDLSALSKYANRSDSVKRLIDLHTNWILCLDELRNIKY